MSDFQYSFVTFGTLYSYSDASLIGASLNLQSIAQNPKSIGRQMTEIFEFDTFKYFRIFFDIRYFRIPEVNTSDFEYFRFSVFDIRIRFSVFGYITN